MKKDNYTDIICKGFCTFYKDGKENLTCGTYNYLVGKYNPDGLKSVIQEIKSAPDFSYDEKIKTLICEKCDFIVDGCDFREGLDAPPCGGYTIIEWLIKMGAAKI